jgi:pheromone shutdown protein TraB
MHNITLIGTFHSENEKCNSDELYKIIKSISPEVIFEELPNNLFDRFYNGNQISDEPLEVKCIKKYLQNHNIKHIPVDIDVSPKLSSSEINYMFDTFRKYDVYRKLDNEQNLLTAQYGFAYLNSNKCSELFDKKKITEKNLMGFEINKNILFHIYKLFHEEQDNRENEMLKNIYNYSKENQYNQAVFLIGSAHRNSLMQKITEYETKNKIKLNWTFYKNQNFKHS